MNKEVGWARALIPYPILPPFLINHTLTVDVKHHERKKDTRASELMSCVNREVGWAWALIPYPILPPTLIRYRVSVDVKHQERKK